MTDTAEPKPTTPTKTDGAEVEAPPAPAAKPTEDDAYARALAALDRMQREAEEAEGEAEDDPAAPSEAAPAEMPDPAAAENQTPEAEAPTEAPAAEGAKDDPARWEALVRAERDLAQQRHELVRQQAEIDARIKSQQSKLEAIERMGSDPLGALHALGVDYAELTRRVLANPAELQTPHPEIERLKSEIEGIRRESETRQIRESIASVKHEIRGVLEGGKDDRFELLSSYPNAVDEVFHLIQIEHQQTGQVLELDKAADRLETYLVDQAKKQLTAKKLQTLPSKPAPAAAPATKPQPANGESADGPPMRTLTTRAAAEPPSRQRTADENDCRARALAVLEAEGT